MPLESLNERSWRREDDRGSFLVSTHPAHLDHSFINTSFESPEMYWAKPLPLDQLALLLSNSVTLGLYKVGPPAPTLDEPSSPRTPSPTVQGEAEETLQQIGFARIVTDHVTIAFLSDVYVLPEHRQGGLGTWLVKCCEAVLESHPALRRSLLLTSSDAAKRLYSRELGFWDANEEREHVIVMTRRGYKLDGD